MPLYDFECANGHRVERLVKPAHLNANVVPCGECGAAMRRLPPLTHCSPDGIYSYAPNVGSAERFERQRAAIHTGQRVIPRVADVPADHRDGQITKSSPYG